jgi:hypothetical protein
MTLTPDLARELRTVTQRLHAADHVFRTSEALGDTEVMKASTDYLDSLSEQHELLQRANYARTPDQ